MSNSTPAPAAPMSRSFVDRMRIAATALASAVTRNDQACQILAEQELLRIAQEADEMAQQKPLP